MSLNDEVARKINELEQVIGELRSLHAQQLVQNADRPALKIEPPRPAPARVVAGPWIIKCCMGDDACNNGPNCRNRDGAA